MSMRGGGRGRRARIATVLGISIAAGALLVLVVLPTATFAISFEGAAVSASSHASCKVGGDPQFPGYDPVNKEVYVPNLTTGNISVLKGTCTLAGTIKLPKNAEPYQALFDPANNYMFVTDCNLNQIYEISGMKIVATYTNSSLGGILWAPTAITYDPGEFYTENSGGGLVVTNLNGSFITWFQPYAGGSYGTVPVGQGPDAIAYNPTDGALWVANGDSDNDTVVNINWYYSYSEVSKYADPEFSLYEGSEPDAVAVDPANGFTYVADFGSDNVSVWESGMGGQSEPGYGTVGEEAGFTGLDGPSGAAWDQSTLEMYITSINNNKVYAVGGAGGGTIFKKFSLPSDSFPTDVAYDAANGYMYVTCVGTNSVYVIE